MESPQDTTTEPRLPAERIDRLIDPVIRFLHVETTSGVVLLMFTIAALVLANSAISEGFLSFWKTPIGLSIGSFEMTHSLKHWINDGLMVISFSWSVWRSSENWCWVSFKSCALQYFP